MQFEYMLARAIKENSTICVELSEGNVIVKADKNTKRAIRRKKTAHHKRKIHALDKVLLKNPDQDLVNGKNQRMVKVKRFYMPWNGMTHSANKRSMSAADAIRDYYNGNFEMEAV